jgi:hypothetical protein
MQVYSTVIEKKERIRGGNSGNRMAKNGGSEIKVKMMFD